MENYQTIHGFIHASLTLNQYVPEQTVIDFINTIDELPSQKKYHYIGTEIFPSLRGPVRKTIPCDTTLIHWALDKKYMRLIHILLDKFGTSALSCYGLNKETELLKCMRLQCYELAMKMIEVDTDNCCPWVQNRNGNTALMLACKNKQSSLAFKIIDKYKKDCKPQTINAFDNNALSYACMNNMTDVALHILDVFGTQSITYNTLSCAEQNNMTNVVQKITALSPQLPIPPPNPKASKSGCLFNCITSVCKIFAYPT